MNIEVEMLELSRAMSREKIAAALAALSERITAEYGQGPDAALLLAVCHLTALSHRTEGRMIWRLWTATALIIGVVLAVHWHWI